MGNRILMGAKQPKSGRTRADDDDAGADTAGADLRALIAHAGRNAMTSTSTRRLGHTSPSMTLSMAAGWWWMISLLTAK